MATGVSCRCGGNAVRLLAHRLTDSETREGATYLKAYAPRHTPPSEARTWKGSQPLKTAPSSGD